MKQRIVYISLIMLVIFPALTSFYIPAENVQIRIFAHLKVVSFQLNVSKGTYKIMADGNVITNCIIGESYNFSVQGDSVNFKKNNISAGTFKYIKLISDDGGELKFKLTEPERKVRVYQDNISFSVSEGFIRIINEIELDNYIAGVTEAEAGARSALEFYKVQSILARTFALSHINKHVVEGFSLCDQVHCQAYFGKPRDQNVFRAIEVTKDKVVVDENLNLIIAAFHSNSGGQTANSEDVWGKPTSYLRSIEDTFSSKMPNAYWERRMLTKDWLSYLKLKHNFPTERMEVQEAALNFTQQYRKVYLEYNNLRVPLKNIRQDLQLKSTFFNIRKLSEDSVLFTGRGYGHGLGMCQEGAMRMVKIGYNYNQVLDFYYQNTQLIDLHKLSFFKDE